ncbi:MAG: rod shape-determining protein MreD [bacterium]|nr:rod shape-determining protein MreD [bacterium]
MKYLLFCLLILVLAFVQTVLVDFNLLLVLVLVSSLLFAGPQAFLLAFFSGFSLDLLSGGMLGFSSLGFLIPSFLLLLYRQRFAFNNPVSVGLVSIIFYLLFSQITRTEINVFEGALLLGLLVAFRLLLPSPFEINEKERIRV